MNLMSIFNQILVLFIVIIVGYYLRKKCIIDKSFTLTCSKLILSVFLPASIINSMQIEYSQDMISTILNLIFISLIMYLVSFVIAILLKFFSKTDNNIGIYQYIIMFSNVGFMGYPIVSTILGLEAIFYTAIFNLPFNILLMTIGVYFLSTGKMQKYSFDLKQFFNPMIISIIIGFVLFIFKIKLPFSINESLGLLGNLTTPLSMLLIGSLVSESRAIDCFKNKFLLFVSFIRLLVLPLIMYIILINSVTNSLLLHIPIIIAAMPAATNTAIMAIEYKSNEILASQAVFLTTLFSLITIPIVCFFLF